MKKTVRVTIEKEFEIEIPDGLLTPEFQKVFSETMWDIDGPDDLFKYAAQQVAQFETHFLEGLGEARSMHSFPREAGDIVFRENYAECDAYIIPHKKAA